LEICTRSPSALHGRAVEHDLASFGLAFGGCQGVDQAPRQDVDQLNRRIADDEPPRGTDGDSDFHGKTHARAAGRHDVGFAGHRRLHRKAARGCPQAVVAIDPARNRIATEVDDVATEPVEVVDQRLEHAVEIRGQLFGAPLRSKLARQRFRQLREPRNVREQRGTLHPVGKCSRVRQRTPPIAGYVRLGIVDGAVMRRWTSIDVDGRGLGHGSMDRGAAVRNASVAGHYRAGRRDGGNRSVDRDGRAVRDAVVRVRETSGTDVAATTRSPTDAKAESRR
jgi:hypothetical protein